MRRRVVLALAAVLVAFHSSLWTLLRGVTVDTPLAYLGLVPIVAAALGYALSAPRAGEPDIHDRMVDRIVAIPLFVATLVTMALLPARMSTLFWMWRVDLLVLPLFVAAVVTTLFGVRMLWRTKVAVAWLFLAWPVPCRWAVSTLLDPLSRLTASTVGVVVRFVPVAQPIGGDGISFMVTHPSEPFRVQIATACSGANSMVGFLLVAGAVAMVLRGTRWAKVRWLLVGSFLVWVLNVVRIFSILAVGQFVGRTASIDVLHPVVGIFTFGAGVLVMVILSDRFGLRLPPRPASTRSAAIVRAVPDARRAAAVVLAAAALTGMLDRSLAAYDPIASASGTARLGRFSQVATRPDGFRARPSASIDAGRRFFGEDSTWVRWTYVGDGQPGLRSDVP
ncbi:MAG: archaeosortase/exosortase family protein, partial [Actinomycetes bacterium]